MERKSNSYSVQFSETAVKNLSRYIFLRELLSDQERLADYLDYLHVQQVKTEDTTRFLLEEVRRMPENPNKLTSYE